MPARSATRDPVSCPFCGLLCEDLRPVGKTFKLDSALPAYCREQYRRAQLPSNCAPRVAGREVAAEDAVARAAELLGAARRPLFAGLAVDVNGARAALRLAEHCGGAVDHMHSERALDSARVMQDRGLVGGTLSEIALRADPIVVVGPRILEYAPRLLERLAATRANAGEFVLLGPWREAPGLPQARPRQIIDAPGDALEDIFRALNVLCDAPDADARPRTAALDALSERHGLAALGERLAQAEYAAIVWSSADFETAPLAPFSIARLLERLNRKTRCVGLPVSGWRADNTFASVGLWRAGRVLRFAFDDAGRGAGEAADSPPAAPPAKGAAKLPSRAPDNAAAARLLADGETDLLVWLSTLAPEPAPAGAPATVVVGHPQTPNADQAEVFIPAGIPGIDHAGHLFRCDSVVSMPLAQLRDDGPPPAAATLDAILRRLADGAAETAQ